MLARDLPRQQLQHITGNKARLEEKWAFQLRRCVLKHTSGHVCVTDPEARFSFINSFGTEQGIQVKVSWCDRVIMMAVRRVALAGAVLLCLASVLGLLREYPAAVFARDDIGLKLNILAQSDIVPSGAAILPEIPDVPMSWRGQRDLLRGCSDVQFDTTMQFMTAETKTAVHQNCLVLADRVLDRAPTVGLAYLVQAAAYDHSGSEQDRNRALTLAQRHAPFEGWQAIRRMRMALPVLDRLNGEARTALAADIAFLMMGNWGTDQIAPLFIATPDARAFIEDIAQRAEPGRQQQFLRVLRQYASG